MDPIVKFQDRLPLQPIDVLRVVRDALIAYREGGGFVEPPHTLHAVELDGTSADDPRLTVIFDGPAGPEEFAIAGDSVEAVAPDDEEEDEDGEG